MQDSAVNRPTHPIPAPPVSAKHRLQGGDFWPISAGLAAAPLPLLVDRPPAGSGWLHEIKHDGYRIIARKEGSRVTLWTRYGTNFTDRLPKVAEAVRRRRLIFAASWRGRGPRRSRPIWPCRSTTSPMFCRTSGGARRP